MTQRRQVLINVSAQIGHRKERKVPSIVDVMSGNGQRCRGKRRSSHSRQSSYRSSLMTTRMSFLFQRTLAKRLLLALTMLGVLTACGTAALQHEEERLTFRVVREMPGWYSGLPDGVREFDLPVSDEAK